MNTESPRPQLLTTAALVGAIACVIARATFLEVLRDPTQVMPGGPVVPRGAGAAEGLWLDLLFCLPAILVLIKRLIDPTFTLRRHRSIACFLTLGAFAFASTLWSSDRFLAIVNAAHFLASGVLLWAFAQLVREWANVRLIAATCLGLLSVHLANGIIYKTVDVPDTIRNWEQIKDDELARRGWTRDSFEAQQFERKIRSGEMIGFDASPNSYAAGIVLMGLVCAGLVVQRLRDNDPPGWAVIVILVLTVSLAILYWTASKAAFATVGIGGAAFALLAVRGDVLLKHRRVMWSTVVACAIAGASTLILYALRTGSLFQASLTFRWRYWIGAMRVFVDHSLTGVGFANFGSYYLAARLPIATEEIKDPHNFLVRCLVELGIGGGGLALLWLATLLWEALSPTRPQSVTAALPTKRTAWIIAATVLIGMLLNIAASIDFSANGPGATGFAIMELLKRCLFILLLALGIAVGWLRSTEDPRADGRTCPMVLYAMIAAAAGFLLHNMIDFAIFEPGPMSLFAMIMGTVLGASAPPSAAPRGRWIPALGLTALGTALAVGAIAVVVPVSIAEHAAAIADEEVRAGQPGRGGLRLREAFSSLWIPNADYAQRAAIAFLQAQAPPEQVAPLLDRAIAADSMNPQYWRTRAEFRMRIAPPDAIGAVADFEQAIRLNPKDVSTHLSFANLLDRAGLHQRATDELRTAVATNSKIDPDDPRRLHDDALKQIEARLLK